MNTSVTHLTSAHKRSDPRIFHKMCMSLSLHGYDVSLVVADGLGNDLISGIRIYDIGKPSGRLARFFLTPPLLFKKAVELDSKYYQLHDPELLPISLKLKKLNKIVIFDFHEDIPIQMLYKPYLNKLGLKIISKIMAFYELYVSAKLSATISSTNLISNKFKKVNQNSITVFNYPIFKELSSDKSYLNRDNIILYLGAISSTRGILELLDSLNYVYTPVTLYLCGKCSDSTITEDFIKNYPIPERHNIKIFGYIDNRLAIKKILSESKVGLVTLHPLKNYIDSHPIKLYEYMAAGIPVIASNFPGWIDIISSSKSGLTVDPTSAVDIGAAINYLFSNPIDSMKMGVNGTRFVMDSHNWSIEETKLLNLYRSLN